jgi:hypothetical protein
MLENTTGFHAVKGADRTFEEVIVDPIDVIAVDE